MTDNTAKTLKSFRDANASTPRRRWNALEFGEREALLLLCAGHRQPAAAKLAGDDPDIHGQVRFSAHSKMQVWSAGGIARLLPELGLDENALRTIADDDPAKLTTLDETEKGLLQCISDRMNRGDIAEEMNIPLETLDERVEAIRQKLGHKTVRESVALYVRGWAERHPAAKIETAPGTAPQPEAGT